jgi:hypothetical protein
MRSNLNLNEIAALRRRADNICEQTRMLVIECRRNLEASETAISRSIGLIGETDERIAASLRRVIQSWFNAAHRS